MTAKIFFDKQDIPQYFCAEENGYDLIVTNDKNFPRLSIDLKRTNPDITDFKA